jgi:hypothetical protein
MLSRLMRYLLLAPVLAVWGVAFFSVAGQAASAAVLCAVPKPMTLPAPHRVVGHGTAKSCTEAALRAAVTAGGYVTFDCGGKVTIAVSPAIDVSRTTVVDGGGKVTLNGLHKNRILVAENSAALSVRNMAFVNGAAGLSMDRGVGTGGAVAGLFRSHVEVIKSSFTGNTAGYGGGAVGVGAASSLTIVGSTFKGNSSWEGGASYSLLSTLTVVNSAFTGNHAVNHAEAGEGGAIATDGASPNPGASGGVISICGTVISHNTGYGNGGGVFLWSYAPDRIVIRRTTFAGNTAMPNRRDSPGFGGAGRISVGAEPGKAGSLAITQSSILANHSDGDGGGFYLDCNPGCTLANDTMFKNSAADYGGAVFPQGSGSPSYDNMTFADNSALMGGALWGSGFTVRNSIFLGNSSHNQWGIAQACASTGKGAHDIQWGAKAPDKSVPCVSGTIAKDPKLPAPAGNGGPTLTMMPGSASPALKAGRACESVDQRGVPRNRAVCDLGAVQRTRS